MCSLAGLFSSSNVHKYFCYKSKVVLYSLTCGEIDSGAGELCEDPNSVSHLAHGQTDTKCGHHVPHEVTQLWQHKVDDGDGHKTGECDGVTQRVYDAS